MPTAERLGLRHGPRAGAGARHASRPCRGRGGAAADARLLDAHRRLVPALYAAGRRRSARRLLLDIGGCAHLFGGEETLLDDLLARWRASASQRAPPSPAPSAPPGRRRASAPRRSSRPARSANDARATAARGPAAADETVAALARVGLKRIGDIIDLPRAPLAARFGGELLRQLDRALGRERRAAHPAPAGRRPMSPSSASPSRSRARRTCWRSSNGWRRACKPCSSARGEGARRLELSLFRTDGAVRAPRRRHVAAAARSARDPRAVRRAARRARRRARSRLRLRSRAACGARGGAAAPEQIGLGGDEDGAELDRLIDRLARGSAAGGSHGWSPQDSHIPELAAAALPAQATRADDVGWDAFRRFRADSRHRPAAAAPARQPEPIEAMADVPDGPPLRFRWRRALHEVVAAEGPERIERRLVERGGGPARDYFRVEDTSRTALLAVPRRALSRPAQADWCRAGSCNGSCTGAVYAVIAPTTRIRRRLEFLVPARRVASGGTDGAGRRLGLAGLGLRDRNSVAGVVRAHLIKREQKLALPIIPARGSSSPTARPTSSPIRATAPAWGRLCRLLTRGNLRAEKGDCILLLDDLLEHIDGLELIVMETSTRDVQAPAPEKWKSTAIRTVGCSRTEATPCAAPARRSSSPSRARRSLRCFAARAAAPAACGWPRRCSIAATTARGSPSAPRARAAGVPLIAVNDVLYHHPGRRDLQDVLTCIREHLTIDKAGRRLAVNAERYLKPPDEMARLFRDAPEAIAEDACARRCADLLARRTALRISRRDARGLRDAAGGARPSRLGGRRARAIPRHRPTRSATTLAHELALIGEAQLRALFPHRPRHRPLCAHARTSSARAAARRRTRRSATASASPRSTRAKRRPAVRALHLDGARRAARHRRRFRARAARRGDPVHLRALRPRARRHRRDRHLLSRPLAPSARSARPSGCSEDTIGALASSIWGMGGGAVRTAELARAGLDLDSPRMQEDARAGRSEIQSASRAISPSMSAASSSPAAGSTRSCRSATPRWRTAPLSNGTRTISTRSAS